MPEAVLVGGPFSGLSMSFGSESTVHLRWHAETGLLHKYHLRSTPADLSKGYLVLTSGDVGEDEIREAVWEAQKAKAIWVLDL